MSPKAHSSNPKRIWGCEHYTCCGGFLRTNTPTSMVSQSCHNHIECRS